MGLKVKSYYSATTKEITPMKSKIETKKPDWWGKLDNIPININCFKVVIIMPIFIAVINSYQKDKSQKSCGLAQWLGVFKESNTETDRKTSKSVSLLKQIIMQQWR